MTTEQANKRRKSPPYSPETQWQPGQSGNPAGRPKNSVTTLLKEKDAQAVADKLYAMALEGKFDAIREFIDRTEGKVTDKLITGHILISTPDMLELATRRLLEAQEEQTKLIEGEYATKQEENEGTQEG